MTIKCSVLRFAIAVVLVISAGILAGCKQTGITTTGSATTTTTPNTTTIFTIEPTMAPYIDSISLKTVPKLGETAEMTYTFDVIASDFLQGRPGAEDAKAWIEFWWTDTNGSYLTAEQAVNVPLSEVVVSGNTTWQGDYTKTKSLHLTSTVKLPRAGIWKIEGYFTGKGWETPINFYNRCFISKDYAMYMNGYNSGPPSFDYLTYFDYGYLKDKRASDYLNEQSAPVRVELDLSKAPQAGEEVTLTCTIASLHDVPDYSLSLRFYRRGLNGGLTLVPTSTFLVNGELNWQGNLLQGKPTVFTTTIKFPQEGEWEIYVGGKSPEYIKTNKSDDGSVLDITIATPKSFYGWKPIIVNPATSTTENTLTVVPTK
jgi:hypothetical protein